jgi:L-threonylcarbamoyladenylate synthase
VSDPIGEAVRSVGEGGLVAYPTETVWGLGADARSDAAVEALRRFKGRGDDAPISILVESAEALASYDFELGPCAERLAKGFWPGPLTLVLGCGSRFATGIARADGAVGVRCSAHPLASALARRLHAEGVGPVTATSLNVTGAPEARTRTEAIRVCGDSVRLVEVEGAESGGEAPSTVVDLTESEPRVLRWGAVPATELLPFIEEMKSR